MPAQPEGKVPPDNMKIKKIQMIGRTEMFEGNCEEPASRAGSRVGFYNGDKTKIVMRIEIVWSLSSFLLFSPFIRTSHTVVNSR